MKALQSLNLEEAVHWTPFLWPNYTHYYNRIKSALQVSRRPCLVNVGLLPSSGSDWWHHPPTPNSLQRHICSRSRQLSCWATCSQHNINKGKILKTHYDGFQFTSEVLIQNRFMSNNKQTHVSVKL